MAFREWKKNKVWVWCAVCGRTRRALGWQLGDRSDKSLRQLIHTTVP